MKTIDWFVLTFTLLFIVVYGLWKSRKSNSEKSYLLGNKQSRWWTIGLSIVATQASAITFLSTPGQAYEEGMGFIQFYLGMPLAMIVICIFFIPIYNRLNVYTAYEYLENRFDLKIRWLAATLFMLSRGLGASIILFAPAIIFSKVLNWDLGLTTTLMGILVLIYTVIGGSIAVNQTHKLQMTVIMLGLFVALYILIEKISPFASATEALAIAGKMGKMEIINLKFDHRDKYNLWSGLIGGFFLALSYFGTDQSQVSRYLSGKNMTQMRMGLLFSAVFKIPMQFLVLLIGVFTFLFFQFYEPPLYFNHSEVQKVREAGKIDDWQKLETQKQHYFLEKKENLTQWTDAQNKPEAEHYMSNALNAENQINLLRADAQQLIQSIDSDSDSKDGDYIFISFILDYLPTGIIGLLIAMILSGAMSSISAELSSLGTTTYIDFYKRIKQGKTGDTDDVKSSKWLTFMWGIIIIGLANITSLFDNLIELVNILGSLFYGTILGIFLVGFLFKKVQSLPLFIAALMAEASIICIFILEKNEVIELGYLWYNLLGPSIVIGLSLLFQFFYTRWRN